MKNINKIIAIAVLTVFAVGCTNEDDLDSSGAKFNKKNTTQGGNERPYPEYEIVNYSSNETHSMLEKFNKQVNDESSTLVDMPIEEALYIMETYLNYGVFDKANSVGKYANKELRTFTFTVATQEGKVIGSELKDKYLDFTVNILNTMRGVILPLSDMYVKDISSTSVTFGLDINPTKVPPHPNLRSFFPEFYQPGDAITVPQNVSSPWTDWYLAQQTEWEPWNGGEVVEYNVYRYSQKPISLTYNFNNNSYFTYYTGIYYNDAYIPFTRQQTQIIDTIFDFQTSPVNFDATGIRDILIPRTLDKLPDALQLARSYIDVGDRVLCDYIPSLYYQEKWYGNPLPAFHLYISKITIGYRHSEQPQMNYIDALRIADIHPEL